MYDIAVLLKSRWGCEVHYGDDTRADFIDAEEVFGPFLEYTSKRLILKGIDSEHF